jgi:hypothetical protein
MMGDSEESDRREKGGPESEISPETPEGAGAGEPGSEGGEGRRNAERTPKLDEGGEKGQTQAPAPPEDADSSE